MEKYKLLKKCIGTDVGIIFEYTNKADGTFYILMNK